MYIIYYERLSVAEGAYYIAFSYDISIHHINHTHTFKHRLRWIIIIFGMSIVEIDFASRCWTTRTNDDRSRISFPSTCNNNNNNSMLCDNFSGIFHTNTRVWCIHVYSVHDIIYYMRSGSSMIRISRETKEKRVRIHRRRVLCIIIIYYTILIYTECYGNNFSTDPINYYPTFFFFSFFPHPLPNIERISNRREPA